MKLSLALHPTLQELLSGQIDNIWATGYVQLGMWPNRQLAADCCLTGHGSCQVNNNGHWACARIDNLALGRCPNRQLWPQGMGNWLWATGYVPLWLKGYISHKCTKMCCASLCMHPFQHSSLDKHHRSPSSSWHRQPTATGDEAVIVPSATAVTSLTQRSFVSFRLQQRTGSACFSGQKGPEHAKVLLNLWCYYDEVVPRLGDKVQKRNFSFHLLYLAK